MNRVPLKLNGRVIGSAWVMNVTDNDVVVQMKITDPETRGLLADRSTTSMSFGYVQEPEQ